MSNEYEINELAKEESWRMFRIIGELVEGFDTLTGIEPAVTVYGSARLKPEDPVYALTEEITYQLGQLGFSIITGGGPGVMEAANKGAARAGVDSVGLNIEGEDLGILIGRRGQTLASLQYIVRIMVSCKTSQWLPIVIDVDGYKERRYQALQALAGRMAEQVKARRTSFSMEPMPAYERRIVHLTLAENPHVTTQSVGLGEARKVVISPRN